MGKNMLKPRAPEIRPNGSKCTYDAIGDQRAMVFGQTCQEIETNRVRQVRRVEVNEIIAAAARQQSDGGLGQIAMWIEKRDAPTRCEILGEQVEQQCRFAGSRLADNVDMVRACGRGEGERLVEAVSKIEIFCTSNRLMGPSEPRHRWTARHISAATGQLM